MLKSIIVLVVATCSLTSAIQLDTYKPGQLSTYQKHHKTPLGVDWQGWYRSKENFCLWRRINSSIISLF
jgi:hypothetical protein